MTYEKPFKQSRMTSRLSLTGCLSPLHPVIAPLRLTNSGHSISGDLGALDWANETAKKIVTQITDKTPYGIQQFSFDYVKNEKIDLPEDMIARMKDSAFRHGTQMKEV